MEVNLNTIQHLSGSYRFLDITDCTVTKSNKYDSNQVFNILVDIKNISESDLQYINNHIYGTVKNRLPGTLYIKRVTVLMEEDGKYDIKIRLFERPKSNPVKSKDDGRYNLDNMNWIADALRGIRDGGDEDEDEEDEEDGYEEDDPDYEG